MVSRLALELDSRSYDLLASSNASRITKRLADGCSEDPRCVFNALNCVKLQHGPAKHASASRMVMQLALELVDKSYDLLASSNASRIIKWLADGCLEGPRCVFSALDCVKLQREPAEHPSTSRLVMRLALELANKSYDLPTSSNASRLTIRIADECLEGPRCNFTQSKALKTQCGHFEHPSASRLVMRLALKLANKSYELSATSNARRITIRLADDCSAGPRCNFTQSKALKTQRGSSEHPSASRLVMRLALKLANKSYDLPESSNASHIIVQLADECLEGPRCNFTQSKALKTQRGPFDHPSTSSNASRLTIRLADECLEGLRCNFTQFKALKTQRGLFEHPSASRLIMRFTLEFANKSYDLPASSNASHIIIRLADECLEGPRCNFTQSKALNMFQSMLIDYYHMPPTRPDAKNLLINLEMDYDKIHACPNDCILFQNEYADLLLCPKCEAKRYREDTQGTEVSAKVLRHFPLIPRIKSMFRSKSIVSLMSWHQNTRSKDGVMRVPADSLAWNHIEKQWLAFKEEPRCLRFGLAMDGLNPFGLRSSSWSTWHLCLVNYNLPPWLAIKKGHLILSLIIPGKYKAKNMDVYLAPLIEELQLLWTGINVVDMSQSVGRQHAHVQGILMSTMHDWPSYGECSGKCYDIQAICDF
ncbi:hypothetical protein L7F22_012531 [Adiantum nelumboides]|nr:hypothetical protein [Adiantum nelumboides]